MKKDRRLRPVILMVLPRLIPPLLPSGNLCAGTRCELRDGREPSPGPRSTAEAKVTRGLGGENRIVCDECTPYTIPAPHAHTHTHTHTQTCFGYWLVCHCIAVSSVLWSSLASLSLSLSGTLSAFCWSNILSKLPATSYYFTIKIFSFFFKESFFVKGRQWMIWEPPAVLLCFTREIGVQSLPASDMNYSEGATELIRQFNDHRFTISGPKVGRRKKKSHHRREVVIMIIPTLGQTCALIHEDTANQKTRLSLCCCILIIAVSAE